MREIINVWGKRGGMTIPKSDDCKANYSFREDIGWCAAVLETGHKCWFLDLWPHYNNIPKLCCISKVFSDVYSPKDVYSDVTRSILFP